MEPIEELLAIEAIKRLKARYFRLLDTKCFDQWGELFTAECTLLVDVGIGTWGGDVAPAPPMEGREVIVSQARDALRDVLTVHHGHMPEITILGPDSAEGIWALADIVESAQSSRNGAGHYHEQYKRVDGEWLISRLHLTRLRREETFLTRPGR